MDGASMGPRHLSRGIRWMCLSKARSMPAGFNGATASEPWNRFIPLLEVQDTFRLQWGHGI